MPLAVQAANLLPVKDPPSWWKLPGEAPDDLTRTQFHSFRTDPDSNTDPDYVYNGYVPSQPDDWSLPADSIVNQVLPENSRHGDPKAGDDRSLLVLEGGQISKFMGNVYRPTFTKEIFVQIVVRTSSGLTPRQPPDEQFVTLSVETRGGLASMDQQPNTYIGNDWWVQTWTGTYYPQPDWERFRFLFKHKSYVDSVWIGTHCVPEPATLSLLGLGALVLMRRTSRTV